MSPKVFRWAIGITIAPRSPSTYPKTIDSLEDAGWEDITLFVEPDVKIHEYYYTLPIVQRKTKYGGWNNFYKGLAELIKTNPHADAYGMIQDDVVFCKGLRSYMEKTLWPADNCGMVSAYKPSCYQTNTKGWFEHNVGNALWGNLAVFFRSDVAKKFVKKNISESDFHIDNRIGQFLYDNRTPPYLHNPSLAQHIGHISTIWNSNNHVDGGRMADDFVGEEFNIALNGC